MSIEGSINTLSFHPSLLKEKDFSTFSVYLRNAAYSYRSNPGLSELGPTTNRLSVWPSKDIDEFPLILQEIIDQEQTIGGTPEPEKVEVVEDHVDLPVERETISWQLIQREPGSFSQGKPGNKSVQEYSYHLRSVEPDPHNPGQNILHYGRYMDNLVQFTTWAIKGRTANNRALWLEEIIDKYQWYFMYRGISRIVFQRRTRDMSVSNGSVRLEGRPLIYYVRTEKIISIHVATLKQIFVHIRGTTPPELRD